VIVDTVNHLKEVTGGSSGCGWMFDEVGLVLYSLVKLYKPDVVIQTGHLWGKSACMILEAMTDELRIERTENNGDGAFSSFVRSRMGVQSKESKLVSIDPGLVGGVNVDAGVKFLKERFGERFEFFQMQSVRFFREQHDYLSVLTLGKKVFGVVDGDHTEEGCKQDLESLANLSADVIFVDDTEWLKELNSVSRLFADRNGYNYLNLPYANGVGILVRR